MSYRRVSARSFQALLGCLCLAAPVVADELSEGFLTPPPSARPRTWWHWMNGNVTRTGIEKDLDWMQSVGLGGVQNFDANLRTPQVVDQRLVYMSPAWKDAFKHAVQRADQNGLEFAIASSPGWSETGGPWVAPEDGLKKLVWSEMDIDGPPSGPLPRPPVTTGPYADAPLFDPLGGLTGNAEQPSPEHYEDIAVLAWPVYTDQHTPQPTYRDSQGHIIDVTALTDHRLSSAVTVPYGSTDSSRLVTVHYDVPVTILSATIAVNGWSSPFFDPENTPYLEVADDKGDWHEVTEFLPSIAPITRSFAPTTGTDFRIVFGAYRGLKRPGMGAGIPGAVQPNFFGNREKTTITIAEFELSETPRVDHFERKAGFDLAMQYLPLDRNSDTTARAVSPAQIINVTNHLKSDGTLDWTPPSGRWHLVRLGWSLIGTINHPATPEATGLEVDKYDGGAVRRYLEHYLAMYQDAVGADWIGHTGIQALLTDSIEVGPSNWTPRLLEKFRQLRGYDPMPWLPTLTGTLVGSRAESDAFLYDFRRTLADLISSEHYATIASVAHEHHLKVYGEALEERRPVLGDDLDMRAHTDIPMSALWAYSSDAGPKPTALGDMKGAASVAHIYGQNLAAAESMTSVNSPWAFAPHDLRRFIDLEFAYGINRPVIHTSVHQPLDDKQPGLSLSIFGQYFNRHDTWAPMARPWIDYIARSAFLLQQGHDTADVAYYIGDEEPVTALYANAVLADTPKHYGYDLVNGTILRSALSVDHGQLRTPGGAQYRALYLGGSSHHLSAETLDRMAELVKQGATLIGEPPQGMLGLGGNTAAFTARIAQLWGSSKIHPFGLGQVIRTANVEEGLELSGVTPDWQAPSIDQDLLFVHRHRADSDIYFVANRSPQTVSGTVQFRVTGKQPERWQAEDGSTSPLSYRINQNTTSVPLTLHADESCFVVFRNPTRKLVSNTPAHPQTVLSDIGGPWTVAFQSGRGAPRSVNLEALIPLNESGDAGIRYFSGIATYSTTFTVPAPLSRHQPLWIDLGQLGDIAEVRVNGKSVGTAWWPPYQLNISAAIQAGTNTLDVKIANVWINRMIGDAQPGAEKIAFVTAPTYRPDAPLHPAGLIGPVRLVTERTAH